MGFTTIKDGPFIVQCTGGNPTTGATCVVTGNYSWREVETSTAVRRKKPAEETLLSNMTAYTRSKTRHVRGINYGDFGNHGLGSNQAGAWSIPNAILTRLRDESTYKVLERVKGETWNLGTFMGELPETVGFLGEMGKGLYQSYRAVKRGDYRTLRDTWFPSFRGPKYRGRDVLPRRAPRAAADKWLAWRFAVQPMAYDLQDAIDTLYASRLNAYIQCRSGTKSDSYYFTDSAPSGRYVNQGASISVRTGVYYKVSPNVEAFKSLGLLNPAAVLWELAPLSFIVDRFLPIGRYIGSLDAMAGCTTIGAFRTTKTTKLMTAGQPRQSQGLFEERIYSRSIGVSLSVPVPKFSVSDNLTHRIDELALLLNGLTSKRITVRD